MRPQSICVALAIVLVCPFALAQWVQTNRLNDRQVLQYPLMGMNVFQETPREFLGLPVQHRMQADFIHRVGSLRAELMQLPFPDERSIPSGIQSQIYVIDTAIVRSTEDTTRHLYSFNTKSTRTSDVTQKLKDGLWVDTLRHINTYDASNNMLSDSYEYCASGQWMGRYRFTYTYDANLKELTFLYEQLYEVWSNGQWVGQGRITDIYDANGNLLTNVTEQWSNGQWVSDSRTTSTYDANGKELTSLNEVWSNGQWVGVSRTTYTYDANGKRLTLLDEQWSNGQWVGQYRFTYTYDANGKELTSLYDKWSNGQWVSDSRTTSTYDAQGNLTLLWHFSWHNSSWTPTDFGHASEASVFDGAGNHYDFSDGYNITLISRLIVAGVASQIVSVPASYSLAQNYPNPFNPSTTIRYHLPNLSHVTLAVFNTLGQQVAVLQNGEQEVGYHEVKFDGTALASGVYFYRLHARDFVATKQLLLLK